jgi:hypothetical protein
MLIGMRWTSSEAARVATLVAEFSTRRVEWV